MSKISFTLDVEPVAKGRPRFAVMGKKKKFVVAYTPEKTRNAESSIKLLSRRYAPQEPWTCPIGLTLRFYMPIPTGLKKSERELANCELMYHTKKPDLDNLSKIVDALNGIFWKDDSQICRSSCTKMYSPKPRIEVEIVELEQQDPLYFA